MSFSAVETSNELGTPIRLYEFRCASARWYFASGQTRVILGGNTYEAVGFTDSGINQSGDLTSDVFTIDMPSDCAPARCFTGTPPSSEMVVYLRDHQPGETDSPVVQVFVVDQVDWPSPVIARASCNTVDASMEREGLRLGYQRACPYAVFDPNTCKANREDFKQEGVIILSNNGIIEIAELANHPTGSFNGGYIEWEHPLLGPQQRGIEEHSGPQIRLLGPSDGLFVGLTATCYFGCPGTPAACQQRFNNYDNYGGFPSMPGESPFNRSSTLF